MAMGTMATEIDIQIVITIRAISVTPGEEPLALTAMLATSVTNNCNHGEKWELSSLVLVIVVLI